MNIFEFGFDNLTNGKHSPESVTLNGNQSYVLIYAESSNSAPSSSARNSRNITNGNTTQRTSRRTPPAAGKSINMVAALPMPDALSLEYGADWSQDEVGFTERGISQIFGQLGITDNNEQVDASANGQNIVASIARSTSFRRSLQQSGFAPNPHKELFYNGPAFRTLPLSWQLSFKNEQEFNQFQSFERSMAFHMHPEFKDGAASGVWLLPETFRIEFVNAKLRRFNDCVLTAISYNPMAAGGWKQGPNGEPMHVDFGLNFMELTPLTKDDIEEGK